jgi:transposase
MKVALVAQPGVSMASVAMSLGINANLLRRWVLEAEVPASKIGESHTPKAVPSAESESSHHAFVPLQLAAPVALAGDIRLEVRRDSTSVVVRRPATLAAECGTWLRELLR